MKIYRKIIHPYIEIDGKKQHINEYKGRWFSEESYQIIMNDIYVTYADPGESKVKFFRRFPIRWEERFIQLSFVMDNKIENLTDNMEV